MSKLHPKSFAFFLEQINQSNRLRQRIGAGIGILIVFIYYGTPCLPVIVLLLSLFMVITIGCGSAYHRIEKSSGDQEENFKLLKRIAFCQVFFDLVLITVGIEFSGGGISPFPLLYILYIGTISIFFPPKLLVVLNGVAIFLFCGLMQLYIAHLVIPVTPWFIQDIVIGDNFLRNTELAYVSAMILNGTVIYAYNQKVRLGWQDADSQTNYLNRLHNLTKAGLKYHQTDNHYQILVEEICELFGADDVYITRWDDELGQTVSGATASGLLSPTVSRQINMTQSVRRAGRPLVAENVLCSPYTSPKPFIGHSTRSLLGVPLYDLPDRHFLGALMVAYNTHHYYNPEEIGRIQQAADVAALLISRTNLYEETQHRADLLQQLATQVTNITSDLRQTTLLPAVVEVASGLLHAQHAALHLYDRDSKEMRCEFSMGLSENYLEQITKRFNQIPGAQVLKNKAFVLIPDVHQDSRTSPIQDLIAYEKFRSYAVFALPSPQGSLGALSLYWDDPHVVSSEEIEVAELFAARAGALLHNARLYQQASEESLTDLLTGLPNRRALNQRLDDESRHSDRYSQHFALLMIDLDGFKQINDTYGHPTGDSVLQQVTAVLRGAFRSTDFISRYGGDEFAVILPKAGSEKAFYVADKLKSELASTRLHLPNKTEVFISASIGIAVYPTDVSEHNELLSLADKRLYVAKRTAKGTIVSSN